MRGSSLRCAAIPFAALWVAGCGPDRGAEAARPPAADSAAPARSPIAATAVDSSIVPVMVGGEEEFDACGSVDGAIGPVAVRSGPGDRFAVTGRLERDTLVFVCEITPDQGWEGIVIPGDSARACGVSSPIATRQEYGGVCRSGWVRKDSMVVIAG